MRGTRAKGYADGLLDIDRRSAEAVVRIAISHTAEFARDRWYDANDDIIGALAWVSTLDSRISDAGCVTGCGTSRIPTSRSATSVPWGTGSGRLHWQCCSTSVPILKRMEDDPLIGTRAAKDYRGSAHGKGEQVRGGGELESFYNDRGVYLTQAELRRKGAAFAQAGVK